MIVKYQIWITIYWQYRQLSLHPRLYGNVGMFGSQVASHDHCLLYSASLIKTNKQTTVKDVIAFYLQTLHIWKTFVNLKRILSAHLLFGAYFHLRTISSWQMRISSCHFQLSTLFLQLANKFGKHDLSHQGSHGIIYPSGHFGKIGCNSSLLVVEGQILHTPRGLTQLGGKERIGCKKGVLWHIAKTLHWEICQGQPTYIPLMLQWK